MKTTLIKRSGAPTLFSDWLSPRLTSSGLLDLWWPDSLPTKIGVNIPSVNVKELAGEYQLELAAPGLDRKDFKLEISNHSLRISAEKEEKKSSEDGYIRREYAYNSFCRTFPLPENINTEKIDAHYENGILQVTIPKLKETPVRKTKEIAVS